MNSIISNLEKWQSSDLLMKAMNSLKEIPSFSRYTLPLDTTLGRLRGYGRDAGQASSEVKAEVMDRICQASRELGLENQAILLSFAALESGFNPDAAAKSSSAAGIFQFIRDTGKKYGLDDRSVFDADKNIEAGIKLFQENLRYVEKYHPQLQGGEKAIALYGFHHDGSSFRVNQGFPGQQIGARRLPSLLSEMKNFLTTKS